VNKLVVVTGAAGFLGRHAARHLAASGFRVAGIGHGDFAGGSFRDWGMEAWESADVRLETLEELSAARGEVAAIVHCAGSGTVGFSLENPRGDFRRTVGTTVDVLEFARRRAPAVRVVYPSSAAVYGAAGGQPLAEDAPLAPISPYGLHKRMAEDACRCFAGRWGVPVAVVRFFSLYGEGLRKQLLWDACRKARDGAYRFFGSGEECRDWLHVADAARLLHLAMERADPACPVVNGGTGTGVSAREVLVRLGGQWRPVVTPGFSGAAKAGDPCHLVADVRRAAAWGFAPRVDIDTGLAGYLRWFRSEFPA
jgi:UDP-glucose 4-epimerase